MARSVSEIEADLQRVRAELKKLQAERRRSLKTDEARTWLPAHLRKAYARKEGTNRTAFLQEARQLMEHGLLDLVCTYSYGEWIFHCMLSYFLHVTFERDASGPVHGVYWKSKEGIHSGYPGSDHHAETLEAFLALPAVVGFIDDAREYKRRQW